MAVDYQNWIADENRFSAPRPPMWFLRMLWDQDAMLVILPSRIAPKYILARRREKSNRVPVLVAAHNKLMAETRGSDGDMLAHYGLQGVESITGPLGGSWSPAIIQQLKERDTWAVGGADAYTDQLEAAEKKVAETKRAAWLDDMDHRAKDAWRSYKARTGQRSQHSNAGHKKAAKVMKQRVPSSSTAGSGFSVVSGFTR